MEWVLFDLGGLFALAGGVFFYIFIGTRMQGRERAWRNAWRIIADLLCDISVLYRRPGVDYIKDVTI